MMRAQLARVRRLAPRRVISALRWRRAMARYRNGGFRLETLRGTRTDASAGRLPVIMCLWNRPERIDDVLRLLDGQTGAGEIDLLLWNNRRSDAAFYRSKVAAFRGDGALASVSMFTSALNVGGIGRFFVARLLWVAGYRGPIVTLDDDQDASPQLLADLLASWTPHSVAGWWAWTMEGAYWARTPAQPGDRVDYVGTGGCVWDADLVDSEEFFTTFPRHFAFVEDIWMSANAKRRGWPVRKVDTPIEMVLDHTNQHHNLADLKAEFYDYLRLGDYR
jgi:hypothetical protein